MTSRERILAVLHGKMPDCVPCCPDISNMVPARMTGKPFTDIYLYRNPPLWEAHIDALKYFDVDGGLELLGLPFWLDEEEMAGEEGVERIVQRRDDGRIVTQRFSEDTGKWSRDVVVYSAENPPVANVRPEAVGLPAVPTEWEPVTGVRKHAVGEDLWREVHERMGDQGVVGVGCGTTAILSTAEDVYAWHDNPEPLRERSRRWLLRIERRMQRIAELDPAPDFISCGGSGTLVYQNPAIFRELGLPVLKRVTEMARDLGIPSHVHSCGPETALVKIAAQETCLTVIDPLEVPPMGDCNLAELKRLYGDKLVLKGNLHTTNIMLNGSADDVRAASRRAIDDAGAGGGFILSTGDQCGRDTPDDNIRAMIETARTYGKY